MIWYIDLDLQSSVEPATAEPERVRRREVKRHIDEESILRLGCQPRASTHWGLLD